jgi:lysophospholipase L1-like esterase
MRRYSLSLIFLVFFPLRLFCADILGIGDSIALGYPGSTGPWPEFATARGLGETTYNAGIGGDSAAGVDARIATLLTTHDPSLTVVIVGSNDVRYLGVSLNSYLSSLGSIRTKIVDSGSSMLMCLITPASACCGGSYGRTETGQQNEKLWNAAIEDWCYDNSVACSANYQEMAVNNVSYEDDLYYDSTEIDGVHVSAAGYTRMATLLNSAAIPIQKRIWGYPSFPTMCYNSWDWFVLAGGASVADDADTGTLILPQNATADSSVECIVSGAKTIQILPQTASGSVAISYRSSSATNFDRDDAAAWTSYAGAFSSSDQFFQVRLSNTAAQTATVTSVALDWTGVMVPEEITPPGLYNGSAVNCQLR